MTSSRVLAFSFGLASVLGFGCSSRMTVTYDDTGSPTSDAGADAATASDAGHDAASVATDAGHDAASVTTDAGHDAATVSTSDAGCASPVCMPLPSGCHYDNTIDPCRCGMILCDPPTSDCSPACGAGEFCAYPDGTCGASGGGTCMAIPDFCSALFDPVCGCDGHTYSNGCHAQGASESVVYHGACETPADCRTAGCPSTATCMACRGTGYICVDAGTVC